MWSDFKGDGGAITPKQWQRDKAELKNNIKLYQWKMEQYKAELSKAEHIKKALEQDPLSQTRAKNKDKDMLL